MAKVTQGMRSQLEAAYTLLEGDTTSLEKFEKIRALLTGIDPKLDSALKSSSSALAHLKAVWNLDVIHLTSHALPSTSEKDKKRKKALLLFITSWKSLKSEVKRVQGYLDQHAQNQESSASGAVGTVVKTGLFAKGPLGIITLAAVATVAIITLVRSSLTTVTIINSGCPPLAVPAELPINIPGIKLPTTPITPGNPGVATVPALSVEVQGTHSALRFSTMGMSGSYTLPSQVTAVTFDTESLLGTSTTLKLGSSKTHTLTVSCKMWLLNQ